MSIKPGVKRVTSIVLAITILMTTIIISRADVAKPEFYPEETKDMFDFMDIPEVMQEDESLKGTMVVRLDTDSDPLNVIRYLVDFETERSIVFPVNVKYINEDGVTKDKSNKLYPIDNSETYVYETKDNDILTRFSKNAPNGIVTGSEDYLITIKPCSEYSSESVLFDENTVLYPNAFGEGIDLCGRPSFAGNKTDIILNARPERNVFSFEIDAGHLSVVYANATIVVYDNDSIIAEFGEIYIKDSADNYTYGDISLDGNVISITVPESFLDNPFTEYPVTVDPTLYFVTTNAYGNANIVSANLNSFYCTSGGTISSASVLLFSWSGTSSFLNPIIKFPNLKPVLTSMGSVTGATLSLYRESAYSGTTSVTLTARPSTTNWQTNVSYNGTSYSDIYSGYTTSNSATSTLNAGASATGYNSFNIKNMANNWAGGILPMVDAGINITISSFGYTARFHGATTATSSKMPRISLSYNYTSTGQVQDGIYMISACPQMSGGTNSYFMTRTTSSGISKPVNSSESSIAQRNYPENGKISYIKSLSQLFRIKYTSVGYTIQSIETDGYLAFVNGTTLKFVSVDDTANYTTRWSFVKVGSNYYIVSYFYHYLFATNPTGTCDLSVKLYSESDGRRWRLRLYMLDIPHEGQNDYETCPQTCVHMILSYFLGAAASLISKDDITQAGFDSAGGTSFGTEHIQRSLKAFLSSMNLYQNDYWYYYGNQAAFGSKIAENINNGTPVVLMIKIYPNNPVNPFLYTLSGEKKHFVIVAGLYTASDSQQHALVIDPYPTTDPSFSGGIALAYSVMDVEVSTLYPIATTSNHTMVRNYE